MTWRFLTSGESHGRGLLVVVDGLPAGLELCLEDLASELARRRRGHGRGPRMALERDEIQVWGGLRNGRTTGAPVGIALANGTLALELALRGYGIGPGDEVIVTPRTFIASASCAVLQGATPVFADVNRESQNMTAATMRAVITSARPSPSRSSDRTSAYSPTLNGLPVAPFQSSRTRSPAPLTSITCNQGVIVPDGPGLLVMSMSSAEFARTG